MHTKTNTYQDVVNHAEDVDGRVWKEVKPLLAPVGEKGHQYFKRYKRTVLVKLDDRESELR